MNGMELIEKYLSIVIPTFNRKEQLKETLDQLLLSPVKNCRITILNNCSTDGTLELCNSYSSLFKNFSIVSQPVNLGGGCENYIHSISYCETEYLWILADDDSYDFSNFDDVFEELKNSKYDIIQVGAHDDCEWKWGVADTPKELVNRGYNYFKYSSFLPCTIFRYTYFCKYIKEAYDGIHYRYPHMPSLINAYKYDVIVYLSKKRIVTASVGVQSYSSYIPLRGFALLSSRLSNKAEKRQLITCAFPDKIEKFILKIILNSSIPFNYEGNMVLYRLFSVCTFREKFIVCGGILPIFVLRCLRNSGKK